MKHDRWLIRYRALLLAILICLQWAASAAAQEDASAEPAAGETPELSPDSAAETVTPEASSEVPTVPVAEAPPETPADEAITQLDDITVTATKREKSVREIPASIDAFSGEELERRGASGFADYLRYAPGVSVNQGLDQDSVYVVIRGISANSQGGFFNRPTGLFYQDVTLVNPSIRGTEPNLDPFDMATVEVLKGPQGTLFGGSALAGAVRFVPERAQPGGIFEGRLSAGLTTLEESEDLGHFYALAAHVPVGDAVAVRFAGSVRENAGSVDDSFRQLQDIDSSGSEQGRLIAAWQATDAIVLELTYLRREAHQDDGSRTDNDRGRTIRTRRLSDTSDSTVEIARLELNWALAPFDFNVSGSRLKKIGHLEFDQTKTLALDMTPARGLQFADPFVTQPAFEVRIVSNETTQGPDGLGWLLGGWDYVFGAFYQKSDQFLDLPIFAAPADPTGAPPSEAGNPGSPYQLVIRIPLDAVATEKALYLDTTRHLGEQFELNLGGRFFRQRTTGGSANVFQGGVTVDTGRATLDEEGVSPKLSLTWLAHKNLSAFAAATKGFRYGGINPVLDPRTKLTYKSDHLWNYELGLRTQWLERRVFFDVIGFYVDWTDVQIDQVTAGILSTSDNVGGVRSQGVEAATRILLPWGLQLSANGAYIDARTTVPFESVDGPVAPGTRVPASPYLTSSAQLGYATTLGAFALNGLLGWTYSGEASNNLVKTYDLPAYEILNAGLSLTYIGSDYQPTLSLNANNLLNEQAVVSAQTNIGVGADNLRIWFTQPRTATLSLSLRF